MSTHKHVKRKKMELRIWTEIKQARKNHYYCIALAAYRRRFLTNYNIFIIACSSTGVMGWSIWQNQNLAVIACSIIAISSLLKQMEVHIIPSEKQIGKLDTVVNFYFDYNNKLEMLWMDYCNEKISNEMAQELFYEIKSTEKPTTQLINEVIKGHHKRINDQSEKDTITYLKSIFNC